MFGAEPTWKSAYGYDSIMLLARAVEKSRFMPSKMRDYFTNLKYEGAVGKLEFDKTADSTSELSLVKK
jgi:ABC-type branched-subunit amino acid transport system substrate-binding protein